MNYSRQLSIDEAKCIKCQQCIEVCPCFSLKKGEDGRPRWRDHGEERCFGCQHCLAICPTGALSILGVKPQDAGLAGHQVNPDELGKLLRSRRSMRRFQDANLPDATLEKLKMATAWVPTGVNFRRLDFAFVDDRGVMASLRQGVYETLNDMLQHDTLPKELESMRHYFELARRTGNDVIFRGAPHLVVASGHQLAPCRNTDPIIALSYLEIYAQSLGVGTLWAGIITALAQYLPDFRLRLGIPRHYEPGFALLFGSPGFKFKRTIQPRPMKIHEVR